jgi:phage-related protein
LGFLCSILKKNTGEGYTQRSATPLNITINIKININ